MKFRTSQTSKNPKFKSNQKPSDPLKILLIRYRKTQEARADRGCTLSEFQIHTVPKRQTK